MDLESRILGGGPAPDDDDVRGYDSGDDGDAMIDAIETEIAREAADPMSSLPDHVRASISDADRPYDPNRRQTGPKGVKEDYRRATMDKARRLERKALERKEMMREMSEGKTMEGGSYSLAAKLAAEEEAARRREEDREEEEDSDDEEDEDDDDFMAAFRAKRLAEMRAKAGRPDYGRVFDVDKFEFLDAIDSTDPRVFVVAYLFEKFVPDCRKVGGMMDDLARRAQHTKFLRIRASEAKDTFDHIALPAFLVYRAGELVATMLRVTDEFDGDDFVVDDLESLLVMRGFVDSS
eukprot:PLAT15659.1.p1 GENE.PLAT15659.1~~PLAT15659.1.p1  ORF type:complete len:301 (-),score=108.87 PLAT15659.1:113-991(-)